MKLALKYAFAAIIVLFSFATSVAADPFEDVDAAFKRGDYATERRLLRPLAEQGNSVAQAILGNMYYSGTGVPQNSAEAVKWHRRSAEQGFAEAQMSLGAMYNLGRDAA
jgi:hypothetical protein